MQKTNLILLLSILLLILISACQLEKPKEKEIVRNDSLPKRDSVLFIKEKKIVVKDTAELEKKLVEYGLINIQTLDSSIHVDLKYASIDNFMKMNLYGDIQHAYLQKEVAEKLVLAQQKLKEINQNYSLIIYDACRPVSVQQKMWDSIQVPAYLKSKYVANPKSKSGHNYGVSVDVSIFDLDSGKALNMGSGYDFFGEEAQPKLEQKMLKEGKITQLQLENRLLLRKVMQEAGFTPITSEWWHFNAMSRASAAKVYRLVE